MFTEPLLCARYCYRARGSANYGLQARSGPGSIFVNKVLSRNPAMLIIYALLMAVFMLQGRAESLRQRQYGLQSRKCLLFGLFPERKSLLSFVLYDWDRDTNNKGNALLLTLHSVKEMVCSRRRIKENGGQCPQ